MWLHNNAYKFYTYQQARLRFVSCRDPTFVCLLFWGAVLFCKCRLLSLKSVVYEDWSVSRRRSPRQRAALSAYDRWITGNSLI